MKKIAEFSRNLNFLTVLIVRCGMTVAILFSMFSMIIYRFGENFNIYMNKFELSEQFISSAAAFLILTPVVAALSEYCMRTVHSKKK